MPDGAAPSPSAAPPGSGDEREQKLAALRGRLQAEAAALATAVAWTACLQAAARLPGERFANIVLIAASRPGASMVRGYEAWRGAGYQVRQGEPGTEIFAAPPRRLQGAGPEVPSWRDAARVAYVWDIAQTSSPPPAARAFPPGGHRELAGDLREGLRWLARREGFAVEQEQGAPADGVTFWTPRRIRLPPGLTGAQTAWALAHQLGHVLAEGGSPHLPGETTSGAACTGVRKAEADAVAFIVLTRYGIPAPRALASPAAWAGTDPRADPAAAILAAGERVTAAAAQVTRHLDTVLPGRDSTGLVPAQPASAPQRARGPEAPAGHAPPVPPEQPPVPAADATGILRDATKFYTGLLAGSWAQGYLRSRGIDEDITRAWGVGYAPAGWTALLDHLHAAGYGDELIEAAGLARRSSRGTLIDHFRDRVVLPVRDPRGQVAGFTARARPGSPAKVPKYINSPASSVYSKGSLLLGLWEGRQALAAGAVPVLVEGPFDAIAVTAAGAGRFAGLAPCGTALTDGQVALLRQSLDLAVTGALVAFDDDQAGRKAAVRAFGLLRPATSALASARLAGRDPAQILQESGPRALRDILANEAEPLLSVVIDAEIAPWESRLGEAEGPLRAMRAAAVVLAELLPPDAAGQLRQITAGAELTAFDEQFRHAPLPQLPAIARVLPADTSREVVRLAERLGHDASDVLIEVANSVTRHCGPPAGRGPAAAAPLAAAGFPAPPLSAPAATPVPGARCPSRQAGNPATQGRPVSRA